jgi:hypothetical protein
MKFANAVWKDDYSMASVAAALVALNVPKDSTTSPSENWPRETRRSGKCL